jgi:hypothetical protein
MFADVRKYLFVKYFRKIKIRFLNQKSRLRLQKLFRLNKLVSSTISISKMKLSAAWSKRLTILEEAKATNNIKATARRHKIYPNQIRYWRKQWNDIVTEVGDDADKMKHVLKLKHYHKGPTWKTDDAFCESLFYFFKELRNEHRSVNVHMLIEEYRNLARINLSDNVNLNDDVI